jgi:hypothetical protein
MCIECGVKNNFRILVYSKEYIIPNLLFIRILKIYFLLLIFHSPLSLHSHISLLHFNAISYDSIRYYDIFRVYSIPYTEYNVSALYYIYERELFLEKIEQIPLTDIYKVL